MAEKDQGQSLGAKRSDEMQEARYRRQIAAYERKRKHRRKVLSALGCFVLLAAVTAALVMVTSGRSRGGGNIDGPADGGDGDAIPEWITQDLLEVNEYSRPGTKLEQVNGVVVHYVGNPNTTAKQNRNYFANLAKTHETSASSHFLVGLEGEIIQCVPLDEWSYCSSQRNFDTIAIEVCHPDETGKFNDATVDSLVKLLKWLVDKYGLTREQVIRHYDVTGKICPKYYVDNPDAWEALRDMVFDGGEK